LLPTARHGAAAPAAVGRWKMAESVSMELAGLTVRAPTKSVAPSALRLKQG